MTFDATGAALVRKAREAAYAAHSGQTRKYSKQPYVTHPERVADHIARLGCSAELQAAALLHDVVEDCGVTIEHLVVEFGDEIAAIVAAVSDPPKVPGVPRGVRKAQCRARLAASHPDAQTLKLCDRLDNLKELLEDSVGNLDAFEFLPTYVRETRLLFVALIAANPYVRRELELLLNNPGFGGFWDS